MISAIALGLVATALLANAEDTTTFAPVLNPDVNVHNISNVVPQTAVTLVYANSTDSAINVTHTMKYPSLILEEIGSITDVVCSDTEVDITFNNVTVLSALAAAWSADANDFVLITNHFGNCDAEAERGIYIASKITCDTTTLVCTAVVEKSAVRDTAAGTAITFGGIPTTGLAERTTWSDSFSLGGAIALPADTVLFKEGALTVTADTASLTAKTTFSGYLYFNWWILTLEDLYFDLIVDYSADLEVSVNVTSGASKTFSYTTPGFTLPAITIPGLFTVTPTIDLEIGAYVSVAETLDLTSTYELGIPNGNLHLDLVNWAKTSSTGWTPVYTSELSVSGQAAAEFNPFIIVDVNMGLAFDGVVMPAEAIVETGFNNTITLTGNLDVGTKGVTATTSSGTCAEGLELDTQFVFGINVYLIGILFETLYPTDITLWDMCFGW